MNKKIKVILLLTLICIFGVASGYADVKVTALLQGLDSCDKATVNMQCHEMVVSSEGFYSSIYSKPSCVVYGTNPTYDCGVLKTGTYSLTASGDGYVSVTFSISIDNTMKNDSTVTIPMKKASDGIIDADNFVEKNTRVVIGDGCVILSVSKPKKVTIYDTYGRVYKKVKVESNLSVILPPGAYLVEGKKCFVK